MRDMLGVFSFLSSTDSLASISDLHDLRGGEPPTQEQKLWERVIAQALMDVDNSSFKRLKRIERAQAIAWLSSYSEDFLTVCAYAGLDPALVRARASEVIQKGIVLRDDTKKQKAVTRKRRKIITRQVRMETKSVLPQKGELVFLAV